MVVLDALDEATRPAAAGEPARRTGDRGRRPRRPPGRRAAAPLHRHRGDAHLRHPDRSRLRRPLGAGRVRHAAARGARRARPEDRELHALGPAAARRRAARLRPRGRPSPARAGRRARAAAARRMAASTGRSRSAATSRASATSRDVDAVFARLPRINSLSPGARAIARELVGWREEVAERQDRPVSTVLNDAALVEIAKRAPRTPEQLDQIRGVNPGSLRRRGADLLRRVARGATRRRSRSRSSATSRARRSTARRSRSPRRSCARARSRPASPTS